MGKKYARFVVGLCLCPSLALAEKVKTGIKIIAKSVQLNTKKNMFPRNKSMIQLRNS